MKYILLIHDDEKAWGKMSQAEQQRIYAEYGQFSEQVKSTGQYLAGSQLQPTSTATSVRIRDAKRLVTDGPFAETREQLGGYYLVQAEDLDEAIELAPGSRRRASAPSKSGRWWRWGRSRRDPPRSD